MERCERCGTRMELGWEGCPYCTPLLSSLGPERRPGARFDGPARNERPAAASSKGVAYFVMKSGARAGSAVPLGDGTSIGRDPRSNEIVIDDPRVSRRHGRVRLEHGSFFYYDLASQGGSWVARRNGDKRRISGPVRLVHGDVLQVGRTELVFMEART